MKNKKILKTVGNMSIDLIAAVVRGAVGGAVSAAMWNQDRVLIYANHYIVLVFKAW